MIKRMSLIPLASLLAFGFVIPACADADQQGSETTGEASGGASTADFESAPGEVEVEGKAITVQDSFTLPRGDTFHSLYSLDGGRTLTLWTSNGSPGMDTVLVLFMRCDNGTTWVASPWTQQVCITTLALNDDTSGGSHSYVRYKNNTWTRQNVWIVGFGWGTSTGTARLEGNVTMPDAIDSPYPNTPVNEILTWGTVNFTSGSYAVAAPSQTVYTSGGGDPVLFAFGNYFGAPGAWNDDTSASDYESTITGLAAYTWYVPIAVNGRPTGSSTLYW